MEADKHLLHTYVTKSSMMQGVHRVLGEQEAQQHLAIVIVGQAISGCENGCATHEK